MLEDIKNNININNNDGLVLIEKGKYDNIAEVTHKFNGESTMEEVIRDMVLSKLKDKNIIL